MHSSRTVLILAPVALRARCLAAFDLDPTKVDPLTFGARTHRRLRVSIATDTLTSTSTTITAEESSIEAMMDEAQLESIDEELYGEASYLSAGSQTTKVHLHSRSRMRCLEMPMVK